MEYYQTQKSGHRRSQRQDFWSIVTPNQGSYQRRGIRRSSAQCSFAHCFGKSQITKAINAGLGKGTGGEMREIVYEGFGQGGIGFLAVVVTDNANRTTSEVKNIFNKFQGSVGSPGSVAYMFVRNPEGGYICTMPMTVADSAQQKALQNLMNELRENDDVEEVFCSGEWPEKE